MQWLQPPEDGMPEAGSGHGTLDFLLRRMRYKSDFPALSDGVLRIQRLSSSETDSLQSMADEILNLGAMFYNLGPLLTEYYFPDEAQTVREELERRAVLDPVGRAGRSHPDVLADQVAAQVMGLGFEALGLGVARHWGLPEGLQRCMRRPDTASPGQRLPTGAERTRWLAVAANEAAAALWDAHDDDLPQQLDGVVQRHGRALGLAGHELRRAGDEARRTMAELA
ncbi:MAG: hypothetical protein CFE45_37925, partial [Burkholderiales bacterium PBB5]